MASINWEKYTHQDALYRSLIRFGRKESDRVEGQETGSQMDKVARAIIENLDLLDGKGKVNRDFYEGLINGPAQIQDFINGLDRFRGKLQRAKSADVSLREEFGAACMRIKVIAQTYIVLASSSSGTVQRGKAAASRISVAAPTLPTGASRPMERRPVGEAAAAAAPMTKEAILKAVGKGGEGPRAAEQRAMIFNVDISNLPSKILAKIAKRADKLIEGREELKGYTCANFKEGGEVNPQYPIFYRSKDFKVILTFTKDLLTPKSIEVKVKEGKSIHVAIMSLLERGKASLRRHVEGAGTGEG